MSSLLIRYVMDILAQEQPRHYWADIEQDGTNIRIKVMLIKDLALEQDRPLGYNNKNHPTKFTLELTRSSPTDACHVSLPKGSWGKVLYAILARCSIEIWEHNLVPNYCGMEVAGVDIPENTDQLGEAEIFSAPVLRKEWFPATAQYVEAGDLNHVLSATEVVKMNK